MKQFLIIGAGRYGSGIVKELYKQNADVVVCDSNEKKLDEIDQYATHCLIGDFTDSDVLNQLKIDEFDSVFVAIGTNAYSAILITKKMKERNAKRIIAKAINPEVGEILQSIGADRVIYPEEEAGRKVARQELMTGVIEYLEITKDVSIVELEVPQQMLGKSLSQLDFSRKYDLTVSIIIRNDEPILTHFADIPFREGDKVLIVGENSRIERFEKRFK
ncbi:potassium channel family protein [Bacillus massiliigorillae]|uniref:potassium channel family protein n=1 Tax=Bacillus massiliigorillae TaxID=1243664 RepID=UPI00039EB72E|nr:TrkA family potassium uptake protein [Bacillus massiliigorillae]